MNETILAEIAEQVKGGFTSGRVDCNGLKVSWELNVEEWEEVEEKEG